MSERAPLATALVVLVMAGCGTQATQQAAPPGLPVTASIFPLAEFSRRIGGDRVSVQTLVPAGGGAHDFQPAPRDLTRLARTRLFIYNGAGFESWAARVIPLLSPGSVVVNATAGIGADLILRNGGADPHVWLDPVLAEAEAAAILRGLVRANPEGQTLYEANAAALMGDLRTLHQAYAAALATCRQREFISAHAAFGYLARRYGLHMTAIAGSSPDAEAEPSAARLAEVVRLARQRGIQVVYTDALEPSRAAEAVAREAGLALDVLHTLEGLTAEQARRGAGYFELMHENLRALLQGLDCR